MRLYNEYGITVYERPIPRALAQHEQVTALDLLHARRSSLKAASVTREAVLSVAIMVGVDEGNSSC